MAQSDLIINSLETLKDYIASKDNTKNFVYFSPIPEALKTEKCILGGKFRNLQN